MLALVAYHAVRVAWFGHFWPTPFLVKLEAAHMSTNGLEQLGYDLVNASGPVTAALVFRSPRQRWYAWMPLVLCAAILVKANGDWMAFGRLLAPGIAASSIAWASAGKPDRRLLPLAAVGLLVTAMTEPREPWYGGITWRRPADFSRPWAAYQGGLDGAVTPDVAWIVDNVPNGDTVLTGDVGLPGNIHGIRVRDTFGLVDREFAEYRAGRAPSPVTADAFGPGRAFQFYRYRRIDPPWPQLRDPPPTGVFIGPPVRTPAEWSTMEWWSADARRPSAAEILVRWTRLSARYPSIPWLAWRHALALAEVGPLDAALARTPWTDDRLRSLSFTRGPGLLDYTRDLGFCLWRDESIESRPLSPEDVTLTLDAANPGDDPPIALVSWSPACGTPQRIPVGERQRLPIPDLECAATSRLMVQLLNPRVDPPRYLYATIDRDPPEAALSGDPAVTPGPRGYPMYWSRTLRTAPLPADVIAHAVVALDVDDPGVQGALVEIATDPPCAEPVRYTVLAAERQPLPTTCTGPASILVTFMNDDAQLGFDRNAYARVVEGPH